MSWLPILGVALAAFALAAGILRLPRSGWPLFGAALLLGLAGYAAQGSPGQPAAPRTMAAAATGAGPLLVEARRSFYDPAFLPSRFVVTADGYTRRGDFLGAAGFLRNAVTADAADAEAWVALGNVLVEHAGGTVTPAALVAYERALRADPRAPAAGFFYGLAMVRQGQPEMARRVWREALERAPDASPGRAILADRLARLDALLADLASPPAPR